MKKAFFFALTALLLACLVSCTAGTEDYAPGSGTASRADISYADYSGPSNTSSKSGQISFDEKLVISGDWHLVDTER